jgi:hypothetical protein
MITYGNRAGRKLLEERHDMKEKMNPLEKMVIDLQDQ